MARAKRTDRAESRRRYRAYLADQADAQGVSTEDDDTPEPQPTAKASRSAATPVIRPGERVGIVSAFRLALRPVHYFDDLRYAPTLILKTNAIWPPALISLVSLAYALTRTDYNDSSIQFLISFALPMTPLIQPMLAGFFAPRATWLAGIIASVISGFCFEIMIIWWFSGHLGNVPANQRIASDQYISLTLQVFLTALTFGALLGAASGWYKRFLNLAGGGGARNQKRSTPQKSAPRRSSPRR